MIIQKKKEHSVNQKFQKLDELLKKKKEEKLLLSKTNGKKDGVGKKGDADVHSVAAVADTPTNHKRDGDTNVYNIVSSFHFLYEFTVNLNSHYV